MTSSPDPLYRIVYADGWRGMPRPWPQMLRATRELGA